MDAVAELERDPISKHQIQPEYGDEQADAGRDCRTRLARPTLISFLFEVQIPASNFEMMLILGYSVVAV